MNEAKNYVINATKSLINALINEEQKDPLIKDIIDYMEIYTYGVMRNQALMQFPLISMNVIGLQRV
jgi:hypothetical protein